MVQLDDGRWKATLSLGVVGGKRRRRVLYARTKEKLLTKLREAQAALSGGASTK